MMMLFIIYVMGGRGQEELDREERIGGVGGAGGAGLDTY